MTRSRGVHSNELKHGRSLRPGGWKKGGTKIMHIFMKEGEKERLKGRKKLL